MVEMMDILDFGEAITIVKVYVFVSFIQWPYLMTIYFEKIIIQEIIILMKIKII